MHRTVQVTVKIAWWLNLYLNTLILFCRVFNVEPDMSKVERMIERSVRLKVGK